MTKKEQISIFLQAKVYAIALGTVGFMLGIIYAFGGLMIDTFVTLGWITSNEAPGLSVGTILAFGALIGMPAIGAIVGFVLGSIVAGGSNLYRRLSSGTA